MPLQAHLSRNQIFLEISLVLCIFGTNGMGRIFLFFLWLVVVGAIARAIYAHRWEIAEDFIGFAIAAVIAVVVYVVKRLKASKTAQVRNIAERVDAAYVPIFGSFYLVLISCGVCFFLLLLLSTFME